ncbi:hypothetical protein D3C73_1116160 [compost metagenome]
MPAEAKSNHGHDQQCEHFPTNAVGTNEQHHQQEGNHQGSQVQLVTVRQHQRLGRDNAAQFAKGHDRTGKGHRTDEDTEEHFGKMDIFHHRFHGDRTVIQVAVEANQHRSQPHEAVQHRHQFRHFGHFDLLGQIHADGTTDDHRDNDPAHVTGIRPEDGGDQRDRHPSHAEQVTLLGRFMARKTGQAENKQNSGNNVCSCN